MEAQGVAKPFCGCADHRPSAEVEGLGAGPDFLLLAWKLCLLGLVLSSRRTELRHWEPRQTNGECHRGRFSLRVSLSCCGEGHLILPLKYL